MKYYPLNPEPLIGEIFKDIEGYEGAHQISNFGRVKSFKRNEVKILKPYLTNIYLAVDLLDRCVRKFSSIHILVAKAFIPNPENKPTVNHENGNKFDNCISNLSWATYKENNEHAYDSGLKRTGENNVQARLTNEEVAYCRKVHVKGDKDFGRNALARKFGVTPQSMAFILSGKTYKNVEQDVDNSGEKS